MSCLALSQRLRPALRLSIRNARSPIGIVHGFVVADVLLGGIALWLEVPGRDLALHQ